MIRRLTPADAAAWRDLRLAALTDAPAAFTADHDDEAARPLAAFADHLATSSVFAAEGANRLDATAGFYIRDGRKTCHRGMLWGLYVRPEARGQGLARALIETIKAHARGQVEELALGVGTDNPAAIALYRATGFVRIGGERRAIRIGDRYHDEWLMSHRFRPATRRLPKAPGA